MSMKKNRVRKKDSGKRGIEVIYTCICSYGDGGRSGKRGVREAHDGVFLSRLSRRRFISGPTKTNGEIVSKILTAHLCEHVYVEHHVPRARRTEAEQQESRRKEREGKK